jgi:hypothetical protein
MTNMYQPCWSQVLFPSCLLPGKPAPHPTPFQVLNALLCVISHFLHCAVLMACCASLPGKGYFGGFLEPPHLSMQKINRRSAEHCRQAGGSGVWGGVGGWIMTVNASFPGLPHKHHKTQTSLAGHLASGTSLCLLQSVEQSG